MRSSIMATKAQREIFNRCEWCYNSSDVITFKERNGEITVVPGDRIEYELRDKDNCTISERCENHFTEEEVEEYNKEYTNTKWVIV